MSSLEQAHDLPKEVDDMVHAWQRGDTSWFAIRAEIRPRTRSRRSINRCWCRATASGSRESRRCSTMTRITSSSSAPLIWSASDSVIDLLKKDGIGAAQR